MMSKTMILSALLAYAEARFGQEQVPVQAVSALGSFGNPGEAATLAGGIPGSLLAGASACAKLELADKIVTQLGNDQAVIDAAIGLVAAEQNFNPFAVSIPKICDDASLPATEALRGVIPLVDPAVGGSATQNANSATSVTTPFSADGLSVAQVMIAQGFSNFTLGDTGAAASAGGAGAGNANAGNGNANAGAGNANTGNGANTGNAGSAAGNNTSCTGGNNNNNNAGNAGNNNNAGNGADAGTGADAGAGAGAGTVAGTDFGLCEPTMGFLGGRNGRKATEFTFLPIDPLVAQGQQEALNPNIITNRICDQLTNVCEANQAAKDLCLSAKATISAAGTRDASTAEQWNSLLGFAGTNISQ